MSKASNIAAALAAQLALITTANGFETNIGSRVYRGLRKLDTDKIPCAILAEGDDDVKSMQPGVANITQTYIIEGHAACDPENPNDAAHAIIADIKRTLFAEGVEYGCREIYYVGRTIAPREDGMAIVSASVIVQMSFAEKLATP
ncbi:MAG: hypothetical protein BWY57_01610 [Betaproteobacteria bacterium ADurb.Bin341]|nr:MAG: hypothetical protein BWY57_01610 [Betaproteobacteria bacterium ADurb.Bin341]